MPESLIYKILWYVLSTAQVTVEIHDGSFEGPPMKSIPGFIQVSSYY